MTTRNVKDHGALGDGKHNDTSAFQSAIDASVYGDAVYVPAGRYMIDAKKSIKLKSGLTLHMDSQSQLVVIPNDAERYQLLKIIECSDVLVRGGELIGDRSNHKGTTGEWGMGVFILGSKNVTLKNVISHHMWGDGFYIARRQDVRCKDIVLDNCIAAANRRQGMSVIDVNGLLVTRSSFEETHGTRPSDGIDFEPNRPGDFGKDIIENVKVHDCKFIRNAGAGVEFALKKGIGRNIQVYNCSFSGNDKNIKSDTYSWFQNMWYSIFGYPTRISI